MVLDVYISPSLDTYYQEASLSECSSGVSFTCEPHLLPSSITELTACFFYFCFCLKLSPREPTGSINVVRHSNSSRQDGSCIYLERRKERASPC